MAEEGAETLRWGLGSPPEAAPALAPWAEAEAMAEERDVRFVTEESFDFGLLSPSDSQEEEEDEGEAGARAGGGSGRWSPLHGARLEEMVREATRLAAQLEQCHLSPSARHGPRSPRRETFVVKDSPVRALLPTVEPRGPPPATTRPPAKPRGAPTATTIPSTRKVSPSCHPTAVPKGPPGARVPPPQPAGPPSALPCPGAGGCSPGQVRAPPGGDSRYRLCAGMGTTWASPPWGTRAMGTRTPPGSQHPGPSGCQSHPQAPPRGGGLGAPAVPPCALLSPGQPKVRGGAAPCPPATRQPRTRATTVPVPSSRPPAPSAIPRAPGRTLAGGAAPGGRAPAARGVGAARAAPPATGSGCKPGPAPSRLRPPRKTAMSSTPR
ncbi:proline/serine-rich coiled-coil protein 1 isoform X1 [Falco rusticolus]|uniref:proline/serine-rich coiled-coil protein 1 isoform X1 n=1 Tax=Falco rusticolus TaxID=120794 RepID=UPI001886AAEC|nr:proline/serine-rich coiled-coil protein 1 isoform X1 [Falco rusticolus]